MPILNVQTNQPGETGVLPSYASILTNDTEAKVLTAGYLNQVVQNGASFSLPCIAKISTKTSLTADYQVGWYQVTHVGANWSVVVAGSPGDVVLPTVANQLAHFTGTTGTLSDAAANVTNLGNIIAGASGTAGTLISFSSAASKGSLVVAAVANTGNTLTTLSNAAMGQASVVSIPDPANAIGRLLIGATATPFTTGDFPVNSGTGGLMVDSGFLATNIVRKDAANVMTGAGQITLVKVSAVEVGNAVTASGNAGYITTAALTTAGGGTYVITWTNTLITATSVVTLTIQGGTNSATNNFNFKCVAGAGSATLTILNNTAATALNGTIIIGYSVL